MKILVLTKRQYMGKDLLDDRYGRFRELPLELAKLGHQVKGVCLSYKPRQEGPYTDGDDSPAARVSWVSINLGTLVIPGLFRYWHKLKKICREFQPDLIWACSDAFHAVWGVSLARKLKTRCVVDLYDNFEAFRATHLPGILPLFKRAVKNADGITCVSSALATRINDHYFPKGPVHTLENAVRKDLFSPQNRSHCRRLLGLPEQATIIGTAGALYPERGVTTLFRGFELMAEDNPSLHLAVAGPRRRSQRIPTGPRIHDLGVLPLERVPLFFNALDVAVVYNRDSSFGRYCFPQKAYEIIACGIPFIAADVGAMKSLLDGRPEWLFAPESPQSFTEALRHQLKIPTPLNVQAPCWSDFAVRLESLFLQVEAVAPAVALHCSVP